MSDSEKSGKCDVVIAGGGTAGVVAALASARLGAKTVLIEAKGYPGGLAVEGGTALCASTGCGTRELPYGDLRAVLEENDVILEN